VNRAVAARKVGGSIHLRSPCEAATPQRLTLFRGFAFAPRESAKVDELTRHIDSPDLALPVIRQNAGHAISAYRSLLRFVADEGTPLECRWAEPASHVAELRRIGTDSARRLYEILAAKQELSVVPVQHVGVFEKVSAPDGTWMLKAGKRQFRGRTADGAGNLLSGVVIETQLHRIYCEERLEENVGRGRPRTILELTRSPEPLNA